MMKKRVNGFPLDDREWTEDNWKDLLQSLVDEGFVQYKEIASLVLGHLNPPQVGTSIASRNEFKRQFPKRKCWQAVRKWYFTQTGRCTDCGTRLELQADHVIPIEVLGEKANTLDNMTLRCRRCNVVKRPSHKLGGKTYLTTEAALMWILLVKKPQKYQKFKKQCREYGLTMADIRFQEAWAMAQWLQRDGLYQIDDDSEY